jgi:hypothetical protein
MGYLPLDITKGVFIMTLSSDSELTTLETRIISALTEPMTSTELFDTLSMKYPYGIKVLRKLKHKKLVGSLQQGNRTMYYTIRTSTTELLFSARARATGKSEWLMPFRGELVTLLEARDTIAKKRQTFHTVDGFIWAGKILANLRWNSYRKDNDLPTQRPYANDMRSILERRLALVRLEVSFIEEMLKAPIWEDSAHVWKNISSLEPNNHEAGRENSDWLEEKMYKKP